MRAANAGITSTGIMTRGLAGDMAHGPAWYTAMGGIQSRPPGARIPRYVSETLGSLGDDTLATPTVTDAFQQATATWQQDVLSKLQAGADTLKKEELQRWLQILATLSIPLAAAVWRLIWPALGKRFRTDTTTGA